MKVPTPLSLAMDMATATCLLTRLPLPKLPNKAFENSARAVWSYPLVGLFLGALALVVFSLADLAGLPHAISAGLALVVLTITTGAMHEDGLSDTVDGFWGGQDRLDRLRIMRDSQIGSFGTLALLYVTGLRWLGYTALLPVAGGVLFVVPMLSRAMMPILMAALPHARQDGLSSSVGTPPVLPVAAGLALATALSIFVCGPVALLGLIAACSVTALLGWAAKRKIGGQTGDVLGASQQMSELAVLGVLLASAA